jgi:hypothetical protein
MLISKINFKKNLKKYYFNKLKKTHYKTIAKTLKYPFHIEGALKCFFLPEVLEKI